MSYQRMTNNSTGSIFRAILLATLFIVVFIVTLLVAAFLLLGPSLDFEQLTTNQTPLPRPNPTPMTTPRPLVTPIAASMTTVRNVALGFAVDYPADWRKRETTRKVILSPTAAELDSENLPEAAFWVVIPAGASTEPVDLLQAALVDFPTNTQILNTGTVNIGSQNWTSVQIDFEREGSGSPGRGIIAATQKNEVGYVIVAVAPTDQWPALTPIFQGMFNNFRFTAEAVIRPTEATRPPTPTATPTPRIYVVRSGDTLSQIAVQFNVSVEALAARNGIDDPRDLQTGQRLIIPTRR